MLAKIAVENLRSGGSFSSMKASTPTFCNPMAFSIPAAVSTRRGAGLPNIGARESPLTTIAPSAFRSRSCANSSPYPNVPLAAITGFFRRIPAISTAVSMRDSIWLVSLSINARRSPFGRRNFWYHLPNMPIREKTQLMSASEIERTLVRLAHEIVEKNASLDRLVLIGIRRRGVPLAQRLAYNISQIQQHPVPVGILDITFYRDDVLYTGRTTRAALDALFDHGRPRRVQLLVLIDRGHREIPVEAQYVGKYVETTDAEIIEVKLREVDQMEKVLLVEKTD